MAFPPNKHFLGAWMRSEFERTGYTPLSHLRGHPCYHIYHLLLMYCHIDTASGYSSSLGSDRKDGDVWVADYDYLIEERAQKVSRRGGFPSSTT